jgi:hypothetical protein
MITVALGVIFILISMSTRFAPAVYIVLVLELFIVVYGNTKVGRGESGLFKAIFLSLSVFYCNAIAIYRGYYDFYLVGIFGSMQCLLIYAVSRKVTLKEIKLATILFGSFQVVEVLLTAKLDLYISLMDVMSGAQYVNRFVYGGLHPNLIGHQTIAVILVCMVELLEERQQNSLMKRLSIISLLVLSLIICVGTSSRGALISTILAAAYLYFVTLKSRKQLFLILISFVVVLSIFNTTIINSIYNILQFQSQYRGVDSGLTGRTDGWVVLLDMIYNSGFIQIFGAGFRLSENSIIGISVDNSYLVVIYEFGIPLGLGLIFLYYFVFYDTIRRKNHFYTALIFAILLESFVARYLLSFGNATSMILLMLVLRHGVYEK